ncbi:MAG: CBS domain-containing protein [Burkholderiales bacterium]
MATLADAGTLSLAFMRTHPVEAARVLEGQDPGEAAALLAHAPARVAAPVFAAMRPDAAARSLAALDDERALALLADLGTQPLVAVLRHVAEPRRARLLEGLPTVVAMSSQLMLGYMQDSVGAWTEVDVLALPGTTRAADAIERLRHVDAPVQRVFVTDAERRLEGWVALSTLLRAPPAASLAAIMAKPQQVMSAQTPLAGALAHPGWSHTSVMPVLDAADRLLGAISRDALERALRPAPAAKVETLAGVLARLYWDAFSGGIEALLPLLPALRPVAGKAGEARER